MVRPTKVMVFLYDNRPRARRRNREQRGFLHLVNHSVADSLLFQRDHVIHGGRMRDAVCTDVCRDHVVAEPRLGHAYDIGVRHRARESPAKLLLDNRVVASNVCVDALADCVPSQSSDCSTNDGADNRVSIAFTNRRSGTSSGQSADQRKFVGVVWRAAA